MSDQAAAIDWDEMEPSRHSIAVEMAYRWGGPAADPQKIRAFAEARYDSDPEFWHRVWWQPKEWLSKEARARVGWEWERWLDEVSET